MKRGKSWSGFFMTIQSPWMVWWTSAWPRRSSHSSIFLPPLQRPFGTSGVFAKYSPGPWACPERFAGSNPLLQMLWMLCSGVPWNARMVPVCLWLALSPVKADRKRWKSIPPGLADGFSVKLTTLSVEENCFKYLSTASWLVSMLLSTQRQGNNLKHTSWAQILHSLQLTYIASITIALHLTTLHLSTCPAPSV